MHTDLRGFRLASDSTAAAHACRDGMEGYANWRADAMGQLLKAMEADQGFALPKLAVAWVLHLGRSADYAPKIAALLNDASAQLDPSDARAVHYRDALVAASQGNSINAATTLDAWLAANPTDLFAQRLVQFELFWSGRAVWMRDIVERSAHAWDESLAGFAMFLSCRSFANEENGDYAAAERYGRAAIEINNTDPWGAHAVAHTLVMQGRIDEGVNWLEGLSSNWREANQISHHLWWHLSLFLLERGETDRIIELLKTEIRNPDSPLVQAVPDATIDIQNVASILLRLELRGVNVGDHWSQLAEICAGRVTNHANAFTNAHDMMVLAATGQFEQADALLQSMREFAAVGDGSLRTSYRAAGIAICEAVLAHRKAQYEIVIDRLAPVRHDMALVGGSHAQRDIFYQLLIDAALRCGRHDLVGVYLRDVQRIGFEQVEHRSLYKHAMEAA